jgi:hypothetical protein
LASARDSRYFRLQKKAVTSGLLTDHSQDERKIAPALARGREALGMDEEEHRIATRHRVLKGARILFGGGSIDCTVRNISETGAALDVTSPLGIPTEFTLATDGGQRPCRVVWRKEKRIGITFEKE